MAKRFTDTGKWDKPWFRQLSAKLKCAWFFILDRCDHAGVWEPDLDSLSFFIGQKFTLKEIAEAFGPRLKFVGKYLVVSDFSEYQYGHLNPNVKVHASVIKRLKEINKNKETLTEGLGNSSLTVQDKDKDKDKDKDNISAFDFEKPYAQYPRKEGKSGGFKNLKKLVKSEKDYFDFCLAVKNYAAHVEGSAYEYIKLFSTFVGTPSEGEPWREFIVPPIKFTAKPKDETQNEKERMLAVLNGMKK